MKPYERLVHTCVGQACPPVQLCGLFGVEQEHCQTLARGSRLLLIHVEHSGSFSKQFC